MNEQPEDFIEPQKLIISNRSLFQRFKFSRSFFVLSNLTDTLMKLSKGKPNNSVEPSHFVQKLSTAMDTIMQVYEETPPVDREGRYGNPAFREFMDKLDYRFDEIHAPLLNGKIEAKIEVRKYFLDMMGSYARLDYGSGHELNFLVWFACFLRLGIAGTKEDLEGFALIIFPKYMEQVIKIQNYYTLEPAGSRGAWSIDDYNLLPFVFGASQLEGSGVDVKAIFDQEKMMELKDKYMYCRMMTNIYEVKSYSLETNSPFISEIHYYPEQTWEKVSAGMRKHYTHEVFEKWPVMQHFWFGNIFSLY